MSFLERLKNFRTDEIRKLQEEIKLLKQRLDERQEAINKTNAYWKKKMSELQRKKAG